jgi:hypothetical protein
MFRILLKADYPITELEGSLKLIRPSIEHYGGDAGVGGGGGGFNFPARCALVFLCHEQISV